MPIKSVPTKSRRGIKKDKVAPACGNAVLLARRPAYDLYWKGRARPKRRGAKKPAQPRPKTWANLVVFLRDPTRHSRSFHISWNGERYGASPQVSRLLELEPSVFADVDRLLPAFYRRIIKDSWTM